MLRCLSNDDLKYGLSKDYNPFRKRIRERRKQGQKLLRTCLSFVLPKANPDSEKKITIVKYWLLECSDRKTIPDREFGPGKDEEVIMKIPDDNNFRYWVDNKMTYEDFQKTFEVEEITKAYFEEKWLL